MRTSRAQAAKMPFVSGPDPRNETGAEIIDLATRTVVPAVAHRPAASDSWGMAAGIAIIAALGAATLWKLTDSRTVPHQPKSERQAPAPVSIAPSRPTPPLPHPVIPGLPGAGPALGTPGVQTAAMPNHPPAVAAAPAANPLAAPTVVFDASAMPAPAGAPASTSATGSVAYTGDAFTARVGGIGGGAAVAKAMVDPKTTVSQGTMIPAILETAINTDVPGYTRAVVSADVRSFDGSRVLVPRSSRLIGEYKSGMQAGQKRAYVIWTRLIRPDGVSVNLASPATSFSGETGLGGKVNTHFFERFGSAMLFSLIGSLSPLGGGATAIIANAGGQSAAAAAVGQSGQIGPTVRVRQGEPIRVFTARDLDFSKVSTE